MVQTSSTGSASSAQDIEYVILLHGIGHVSLNMLYAEKVLKKQGLETLNLTYPSLRQDISSLADWLSERLKEQDIWQRARRIHFVAHSMGGLVTGAYLERYKDQIPAEKMGRVVMLGTPHGGSEVADFLQDNPVYQWVFGPAGQELTTERRKQAQVVPWYDLGMIAGTTESVLTLGKLFINPIPHDGCVSVESTKIEGMKDHITIPVMHSFMAWTPDVHAQILEFIQRGTFQHAAEDEA